MISSYSSHNRGDRSPNPSKDNQSACPIAGQATDNSPPSMTLIEQKRCLLSLRRLRIVLQDYYKFAWLVSLFIRASFTFFAPLWYVPYLQPPPLSSYSNLASQARLYYAYYHIYILAPTAPQGGPTCPT